MKLTFGIRIYLLILIGTIGTLTTSCEKDEEIIIEPPLTVTDIDGNVYNTVTIGDHVWMVENLKTTRFRNGDLIPNVTDGNEWFNLSSSAYCFYDNDFSNKAIFGALYNWYAVNDGRNIAPEGWHVPTEEELGSLIAAAGGQNNAGGNLKETGTIHWSEPNTGATNSFGFNGLPAGFRDATGDFYSKGITTQFWSSTELSPGDIARCIGLSCYHRGSGWVGDRFDNAYSVRCVKD